VTYLQIKQSDNLQTVGAAKEAEEVVEEPPNKRVRSAFDVSPPTTDSLVLGKVEGDNLAFEDFFGGVSLDEFMKGLLQEHANSECDTPSQVPTFDDVGTYAAELSGLGSQPEFYHRQHNIAQDPLLSVATHQQQEITLQMAELEVRQKAVDAEKQHHLAGVHLVAFDQDCMTFPTSEIDAGESEDSKIALKAAPSNTQSLFPRVGGSAADTLKLGEAASVDATNQQQQDHLHQNVTQPDTTLSNSKEA
jgi:hypothetical protein